MVHSLNLLNEFIDIKDLSPEFISNKLTFSGFEVEGGKYMASATKLVSGQIIECEKHPDSDHLHLLKVDCGKDIGVLDIVCGAPNARKGIKVIVALEGCELASLGVTIKKGSIRGYESNGMCCSLLELGLDKSVLSETSPSLNGIEELPEDYPLGDTDILKNYGLDDYLIDINILANRPDCLSVYGMAKELSAVLERPLKKVELPKIGNLPSTIKVASETKNCQAFSLLEIENFKEGKTPLKMERYLQAMGIRSINLIVDIGNFSMLLTGQPLHMYDLSKMEKTQFVVKDDYEGDFVALDDNNYKIIKGDLVVTDGTTPCCLAGVMGGKNVECDDNTSHIGIEAAYFYHAAIRHTVTRTALASDSSSRFIKGVNPYLLEESLAFTVALLVSLSPETKLVSFTKYQDIPEFKNSFDFSLERMNHRLGGSYTDEVVSDILKRVRASQKEGKIYPPKDRLDLKEQCDFEEEVFRLTDSSKWIDMSLDAMPRTHGALTEDQHKRRIIREHLVANGFFEALTYTLIDDEKLKTLQVFDNGKPYVIINPMTADHMYVRTSILPSLFEVASYNRDHQNIDFDMFEISHLDLENKIGLNLAIVMSGRKHERGNLVNEVKNFYDIKGVLVSIMNLLGIDNKRYTLVPSTNPNFHPGRSADIIMGKDLVGTIGEIHPGLGVKNMLIGEIDLAYLFKVNTGKTKFKGVSVFPSVYRDLSFVCPLDLKASDLIAMAKKCGGQLVTSVDVFDVYEQENEKSIAINLTLSSDHTLSESEINSTMDNVIKGVTEKLKVSLKQ